MSQHIDPNSKNLDFESYKFTEIPDYTDLNTVTQPGHYGVQSNTKAATLVNSPTEISFVMIVFKRGAYMNQLIVDGSGDFYTRGTNSLGWGSWNSYKTRIGMYIQSYEFSGTTNASGNLSIASSTVRTKPLIGVICDNASVYVAIGKNSSGQAMLCFRNINDNTGLAETAVSGTAYYLDI